MASSQQSGKMGRQSFHEINDQKISLQEIGQIITEGQKLKLSQSALDKIVKCRAYLANKISESDAPIYGINTGFGALYKHKIPRESMEILQANLVKSHACGAGPEIPGFLVKAMLFLKIQSLAYGHSGVDLSTVERLIFLYNNDALPEIFEQGSLGASGDLAPLAHLALPLIGDGRLNINGQKVPAATYLKENQLAPLHLKAKEGLALLNGTQFMAAYGLHCVNESHKLLKLGNLIGACSLDAFDGNKDPFLPYIHNIRPQKGQKIVAAAMLENLEGSQLIAQNKVHVQDPYSFRCIPQVHGASLDAIHYAEEIFFHEVNGVTDNPNIFPDEDLILSGGNFHGQPLALALDFLSIAMAEIGNISERRTYQLVSGLRGLPEFLVANSGLNSGLMIPQYTAASVVSQNKQLCTPASVDSIVSSNGQEDHVSMGANAATKTYRVIENIYTILAVELITAAQALNFRRPLQSSRKIEDFIAKLRTEVSFIEQDRVFHEDIQKTILFLKQVKNDFLL